jgi:alkanesulfonate monooxygenase SsuD/methylene tetrahydromethanopterin reductase-like flavin-dependent oxidoreductase (luciferase family)
MALGFGITALPDPPYTELISVMQEAEKLGFEYGWTYDSHILWQESYATLPLVAASTEKLKLGHCVTNPGIRDPTITASWYATMHDITNGRMVMGIGRGDSSRRVVGLKPVKVAEFEAALRMIKELMNGRPVEWNGKELKLEWARGELPEIPMYVAGYGPRALGVAGRVGDGVIIQLADPQIIEWIMDTVRHAAEPHLGRSRRRARAGALVPGDGLESRHGSHRALRARLGRDPLGADRLRQGAEVLRL